MIIGNVKSHEDLRKKKQLQQDLLEVEVANEAEMEKRVKDFKNPYVAKPVPPKHKTRAELMKDVMGLTDSLISKFKDIDVPYDIAKGAIMEYNNDPDNLVRLNALFPSIRRKILEATIPSLLTSEMILDIARPILRRSELAYGFAIDKPSFKSAQELESIYGIVEELKELKNQITQNRVDTNASLNTETGQVVQQLIDIYPPISFFESLGSPDISEEERNRYFSELENAFHSSGIPTMDILHKLAEVLDDAVGSVEKNQALKTIRRAISNATDEKIGNLVRTIERIEGQIEGAGERAEQKLSRRHIEQFGDEGARARAEAQGEGSGEESDEEREGEFGEEVRLTRDIRRGTPEEQRQQEIANELSRLQKISQSAIQRFPITRDQRQYIEYFSILLGEAVKQYGKDKDRISDYIDEVVKKDNEIMRLTSIISPQQLEQCYEVIKEIVGYAGLGEDVVETTETPQEYEQRLIKNQAKRDKAQESLAEIGTKAKYRKEGRKYEALGNVLEAKKEGDYQRPVRYRGSPEIERVLQNKIEDQGILSKLPKEKRVVRKKADTVERAVAVGDDKWDDDQWRRRDAINKAERRQRKLKGRSQEEYDDDVDRLRSELLNYDTGAISSLNPAEKKVFLKVVEIGEAQLDIDEDEESREEIQARLGLSGLADLQPKSQRKVEKAVGAREEIADFLSNELGEVKDPAMPISEAQSIANDAIEEVTKALLSGNKEKAIEFMAEAKDEMTDPYAEEKPQSKAKAKPPRPPPEASAELFPAVPKKAPTKAEVAEGGVKAFFQPTAESLASKSARNQKIIKEAKAYFKDEFVPELKSRTEAEQRALLRNIVIKIKADTGRVYDDELPKDMRIFDEPLSKLDERGILQGLESYYFQRQEAERGLYNNIATGEDPPLPKRTKQGRISKAEKEERERLEAERVKGLKKGLGVKKRKPKKEEDLESESSSDEEEMKPQKKPLFKASRIKVGKGIEVVEEPKYRSFGKYVIHIPQLHNNKLNLKYPKSLGTIPSIKPTTISEEYRDFIIDVLDNGKMSEKELKRLNDTEQKHFEKIVNGAGLVETFKLKKTISKDEKEEADRFNLLRGEYLAGNNAPTLLKELRSFILKFMDDGRIKRKDGMGLLAELAVVI